MQVSRIRITNFRGISDGRVDFNGNALLVAGNSVGKSTVCEALDLALGPERMFRRPVIDEFDFFGAQYQPTEELLPTVEVEVVLVNLGAVAERRFANHLRKWSVEDRDFADGEAEAVDRADAHPWCLPVLFLGRFDPNEDDFEGNTFFAHPAPVVDDLSPESAELGEGRRIFGREDKRHCGYLYLRTNRTGTRALSFQRGSLLDTIMRLEDNAKGELWERARAALADLDLRDESKLDPVLNEVESRFARFMAIQDDGVRVHPTDLTRESMREALRLFVTAVPGEHAVPFNRLSTGSLNLMVFALLTYIAELKGDESVIFAMEEPEIALPPHAQRRLVDFVTSRMGQAIVTSHSPYVIERFEPESILLLSRTDAGVLSGEPLNLAGVMKPKKFREERRQFAEAVLGRGVLVVEGATEASVLPVVADVLDADDSVAYTHLDLAGVSIYDAKNDVSVPPLGPLFKRLGKRCFGLHDRPSTPLSADLVRDTKSFDVYLEIPYDSIEDLLITEMPTRPKRAFLAKVASLSDYPRNCGYLPQGADDAAVDALAEKVLLARKGGYYGYAALLVAEAQGRAELPATLVTFLLQVDKELAPITASEASAEGGAAPTANAELSTPAADQVEVTYAVAHEVGAQAQEAPQGAGPSASA